ncbi:hypothetical protein BDV37DRAFT_167041 [Aspergillus pseudonomiae]|uniref:Uncharacterized protein n=1 Tax=Aspergillus pseudonomiae TaxID=1506151 RepID=A0A5N7D740_9EURO|nr:uncharacterized protein BDV37DRAFT_167041 [Aspergillus pseudonomiae]KAE8402017.1 hypothetical protein BDV37DRAFT_167041 [Aspergillus pseudonomiae]
MDGFPASAHMIMVIRGTTRVVPKVTVALVTTVQFAHNLGCHETWHIIVHIAIVNVQLHVQSNTCGPHPVLPPFLYISGYILSSLRDSSLCIADTST